MRTLPVLLTDMNVAAQPHDLDRGDCMTKAPKPKAAAEAATPAKAPPKGAKVE